MLLWIAGFPLILQVEMMLGSSLNTWKAPWMMRYLPVLGVYELEDVKKRTDETIDLLIDCICELACHTLIGDGSDSAVDFEAQYS